MRPVDSRALALRTVGPLRMIFWGGLLCIIDLKITLDRGFAFDILNDFVGKVLIAIGIFRLSALPVTRSYGRAMGFIKFVSVLSAIKTLTLQFPHHIGVGESVVGSVLSLVDCIAMVLFCLTMQLLCRILDLERPLLSWRTTTLLLVVLMAIPLGLFHFVGIYAELTREKINLNLGVPWLPLLAVAFIPMIHFFVSISRMKRAAEELEG